MLQRIRDNSSGPLAYAVVAVLILVFGVWGIGSYLTPSSHHPVATVAGHKISKQQLRRTVNQQYQQIKSRLGKQFDPSKISRPQIRRSALTHLIQSRLVIAYAKNAGYRISNKDVLAALKHKRAFQKNGQFSTKRYRSRLKRAGIKPAQYEAGIRQQLLSRLIGYEIQSQAFAVPRSVKLAYDRRHEKRQISLLRFDPSNWLSGITVSDAEIKKAYKNANQRYRQPPEVKLSYVTLAASKLNVQTKTDKAHLKKLYHKHSARFKTPAKRSGQLLRVPIKKSQGDAAHNLIQKIRARLKSGKSMAELAHSMADVYYRKIQSTTQQKADAPIAGPLFNTPKGQFSSPIQNANNWFIVQPTAVTPASKKPFSNQQVQNTLKRIAEKRARRAAFKQKRKQLSRLAYQAPNSLHTIANKLGLKIQNSGWITRHNGQGIGAHATVRKAAFSKDVRKKSLNSKVIKLGSKRVAVIRVSNSKAAQKKPLAAVRSEIVTHLKQQKARAKAKAAAQKARQQLKSGKTTLDALAQSDNRISVQHPGLVSRLSNKLHAPVKQAAFDAPPPESGHVRYALAKESGGTVVLIAVKKVDKPGKPKNPQQKHQFQRLRQRERRYMGSLEYGAFSAWLRQTRDVKIFDKSLKPQASSGASS